MAYAPATWQPVPLLIGLAGSTGAGKTKSAMELATGIAGDRRFAVLDTERGRARHYIGRYQFDYDQLEPPFTPERYFDKIRDAVDQGYPLLLIDSGSHLWEGQGGLREDADNAAQEMADKWKGTPDKYTFTSWARPKKRLNDFIMGIQQCPIHLLITFRAKEKLKPVKVDRKTEIVNQGWKPIIDESLPFEMTLMAMFHPEAPGVPEFGYKPKAEYLPNIFRPGDPITAEHGRRLAEWAQHGEGQRQEAKPAPKAEQPPRYALAGKGYAKLRDAIEAAGQIAWDRETAEREQDMILNMLGDINTLAGKYPDDEAVLAQRDAMNAIAGRVHDLTQVEAEAA